VARFEALGNNALALLVLIIFFLLIYSKMSGRTVGEIVADLNSKIRGER